MAARKSVPILSDVPASNPDSSVFRASAVGFWKHFIQPITRGIEKFLSQLFSRETEPKVWETKDRDGHHIWHVYDPITGHSATLHSEHEIMAWIEERYYYHRGLV
jgi:hypothetical protein